ncbi:MAG: HAMP domain-containing protein [Bacillota bacterium]
MLSKKSIGICLILSLVISYFVWLPDSKHDITGIDNVYIKNESIYFLESKSSLVNMDMSGEIVGYKILPEVRQLESIEHRNLLVDDNENVFLTVESWENIDQKEVWIAQYDSHFEEVARYEYSGGTNQLLSHQYVNGSHVLFFYDEETFVLTMKIGDINEEMMMAEKIFHFDKAVDLEGVLYTDHGSIYYIEGDGDLFLLYKEDPETGENTEIYNQKIDIASYGIESFPILKIHTGANGLIYFYNTYTLEYARYDESADTLEVMNHEGIFGQFDISTLALLSQQDEYTIFVNTYDENTRDKVLYIAKGNELIAISEYHFPTSTFMEQIVFWAVPIFILLYLCYAVIYIFLHTRKLLVKQTIVMMGVLLVGTTFIIQHIEETLREEELKNNTMLLYSLNADLVNSMKKMDFSAFEEMELPLDTTNEVFEQFEGIIDVTFNSYYEYKQTMAEKNFQYTIYFVQEGEKYIIYEENANQKKRSVGESLQSRYANFEWVREFETEKVDGMSKRYIKVNSSQGEQILCNTYLLNAEGEPYLDVSVSLDHSNFEIELKLWLFQFAVKVLLIMFAIALVEIIVFIRNLRGLRKLKEGVVEMSEGNMDIVVDINSKDEFEDIGNAFNQMARKMQLYFRTVEELRYSYERFVPKEMVDIMKKKNILEINKGDFITENMVVISVQTRDFYTVSRGMTREENFLFLNTIYDLLASPVRQFGGYIENFYSGQMRALFHSDSIAYLKCLMKMYERLAVSKEEKIRWNVVVQEGDLMYGIVGSGDGLSYSTVSDILMDTERLNQLAYDNDICVLLTESSYKTIANEGKYTCRYIGQVKQLRDESTFLKIYDFLEVYDAEEKARKKATKPVFERGVEHYILGEFTKARNCFVDVLSMDVNDKLAQSYIYLCDEQIAEPTKNWLGCFEVEM